MYHLMVHCDNLFLRHRAVSAAFPSSEVERPVLPLPPYSASLRNVGAQAGGHGAATAQRLVLEGPASFRHAFPKQTRFFPPGCSMTTIAIGRNWHESARAAIARLSARSFIVVGSAPRDGILNPPVDVGFLPSRAVDADFDLGGKRAFGNLAVEGGPGQALLISY